MPNPWIDSANPCVCCFEYLIGLFGLIKDDQIQFTDVFLFNMVLQNNARFKARKRFLLLTLPRVWQYFYRSHDG